MLPNTTRKKIIVTPTKESLAAIDGKAFVNFASNDYLQLSQHPTVIAKTIEAVKTFGLGTGSSPQVSGFTPLHQTLEHNIATWLNRDKALLFNSGYHANLGVMTTFANRHTIVVCDKYCHASLIDGIQLSRAERHRYNHQDIDHAKYILKQHTGKPILFVTESIFSMEGTITNVPEIARLAKQYNALLMIDDAHAAGIIGNHGAGMTDYFGLSQEEVPLLMTPFGKALGSMGAVVTGPEKLIAQLFQTARTHRYSTALPASICMGTITALDVLTQSPDLLSALKNNIHFFNAHDKRKILGFSDDATPIKIYTAKNNDDVMALQAALMARGHYVAAIRPPTVPRGTSRLRISLTTAHTKNQIQCLLDDLYDLTQPSQKR